MEIHDSTCIEISKNHSRYMLFVQYRFRVSFIFDAVRR